MKTLLLDYVSYHIWANELFYERLQPVEQDIWEKELPSSFPSLAKTVYHMWDAESIWWQRVEGVQQIVLPSKTTLLKGPEAMHAFLSLDKQWKAWLEGLADGRLTDMFSYTNLKGQPFQSSYYHLLMHLFNHGTYHRGQLVTMCRQLGLTDIPASDFIVWTRIRR